MPKLDREQKRIVKLIRREGRNISDPRLRRIYERAAVQTGLVESGLRNLNYGDADSQGWRQERASLYPNPTNLRASIRRFREEFEQHYDPGEKSFEVAAQVQRPREDLRGRYREEAGKAADILRGSGGSTSGGGGGSRRVPVYETIPAVDNTALRQQAMRAYLDQRGKPGALLELQGSLEAAADIPQQRVRTGTRTVRTKPSTRRGGSGDGVGGDLKELFYNGPGGINVDNGRRVPRGFVSGHTDHVHVAAGQKSIKRIARLAQDMGLTVRELEPFDTVDPVHTQGSFHYRGMAADISGDPKRMARFSKKVARLYGL